MYYDESLGLSLGRAQLSTSLHLRTGAGMKRGSLSFEAWVSADLAFDRDRASFELFGGAPAMGHADLAGTGLDVKYTYDLPRSFALYARGGPRYATAQGSLNGYAGPGFGTGFGLELRGQVRALGFLFAPLFFLPKGPHALGALFIDESVDLYQLSATPMQPLAAPIVSTNIGFAVGTDF